MIVCGKSQKRLIVTDFKDLQTVSLKKFGYLTNACFMSDEARKN